MGRFTLTLKEKVIAGSILGLILLYCCAYFLVFQPKLNKSKQLRAQQVTVSNQINNARKIISTLQRAQSDNLKGKTYYQEKFLTKSDQIPQILGILGDIVKKSKVEVVSVRPHTLADENVNGFEFQSLKITLHLKGRYFAFLDCLKRFLDIPFLVDTTDIQLKKDSKGVLNMRLYLQTYFLPAEESPNG